MKFADTHAETMLTHTSVGMALYDAQEFRLLEANPLFLSLLDAFLAPRWRHGNAIGFPLALWAMDASWNFNREEVRVLEFFQQVAENGQPAHPEEYLMIELKQGKTYWCCAFDPVCDANSCVTHIVQTVSQVTDQVLARQKDVTTQKTLQEHKNELSIMINHELRTPITIIQGFAEILHIKMTQEYPLDALAQYAISSITEQSFHLTRLIEELLYLSRIEHERFSLRRSPCDLLALVKGARNSQAIITKAHTLQIILEGLQSDDELIVALDAQLISYMLNNLLDNAIKYSPEGGKIEIGVRASGEDAREVLIWVKDYGIGIVPAEQEHIFERFHRATNSDTSVSGFGIGLYLVKEVVTHHGGRIWVESSEGVGSTFYVLLPLITIDESTTSIL